MPPWSTVQQLIRIVAYTVGGYALGDGITQGAEFQAAVGGAISLASFGWWMAGGKK